MEHNTSNIFSYWNEIFSKLKEKSKNTDFKEEDGLKDYLEVKINELLAQTLQINNGMIVGIMFSFLARYQEYFYKLTFQSCIIRDKDIISKKDVDYAFFIIRHCYDSLQIHLETILQQYFNDPNSPKIRYIYEEVLKERDKIR